VEMCIPYMRARAESMSNLIISSTPNGIVVVDRDLTIVSVNPAFERIFGVKADDCLGKDIGMLMDPASFEHVLKTREPVRTDESHLGGSLMTSQLLFYVSVRDVVVALVNDVTSDYSRTRAIQKARASHLRSMHGARSAW